jgi:uncharacterized protein (DUF2062 family)
MLSRLIRGFRTLLARALGEHATPTKTGLSVAVGAFCACTPFVGFHIWMALGLATVLRLNRLWAAVGSRASPAPLLALIAFAEIQLSHRLRTGDWVPLTPGGVAAHGRQLLLDWMLGTPLIGGLFAVVLGTLAYVLARRRQASVTPRTPGELPPASSESPP